MNGISIFKHAVQMVLGNLGAALRIGFLPQLALVLLAWLLTTPAPQLAVGEGGLPALPDAGAFTGGLLVLVAQLLIALWVAVAWHRYVLLEEQPGAFLPGWNGAAIWAYFKAAFVLAIVVLLVSLPLSFIGGLVSAPLLLSGAGLLAVLLMFVIVGLPVAWVGYRLSPMLPGAAIGEPLALGQAWAATDRAGPGLLMLALVSVVAVWALQLPLLWLALAAPILALVWSLLTNWLIVMVGAGIATTIYGHYVQGRPLNA